MLRKLSFGFAAAALSAAIACGGGTEQESTTPTAATGGGDATSLAPVTGDATRGAGIYEEYCSLCHGDTGAGSDKSPAVVGADALKDYADDAVLFTYLKKDMPKDDPGSLSDQEYSDVIAWLRAQ